MDCSIHQTEAAGAIAEYLAANPAVVAGVLFGSGAAGRLRPDSDLDLALLFASEHEPDERAVLQMRADLETLVRRDVDLIVLNRASTILAFQVARYGTLLFCRDRVAYQHFLVRLISEYADFKIIRRPIEQALIERRAL